MKIKLFLLLVVCLFCQTGFVQAQGIGGFLKKADNVLKKWESSGIDTNYIRVPKYDRQIYIGGYSYYQQHDMDFPVLLKEGDFRSFFKDYLPSNFNQKNYVSTDMSTTQTELELGVDWRGLTIELPITLYNKYSTSFGLAKNGSVWGFRIRYKHLENMTGTLDDAFNQTIVTMINRMSYDLDTYGSLKGNTDPVTTTPRDIEKGELDLKTFYAEGYYVFNHKKFSLGAGMFADMVQLRPAGSFFLMGNYYQSYLRCQDLLNYNRDNFRTNKVSVGLGYGYNLPFYEGRLCFHLSVIPMFSLLNRVTHTGWDDSSTQTTEDDTDPDTEEYIDDLLAGYNSHYYDACDYGRDSAFKLNGFARFAVNYSFDRFILTFLTNYRQYLFGSAAGLEIGNREFDAQLNLCWRF